MNKNSFLVQMQFKEAVSAISDQAAGQVFKGLFDYAETGQMPQPTDPTAVGVLLCFKSSIDEAFKRYEERCEKNRNIANERWGKEKNRMKPNANVCERIQTHTNECEPMRADANRCLYDNDNDNEVIKDNYLNPNQRLGRKNAPKVVSEIITIWNEVCTGLPKVRQITDKRKASAQKLINFLICPGSDGETLCKSKDEALSLIRDCFTKINESNFCKGDGKQGWRAGIDWALKTSSFIKVLEGSFDNAIREEPPESVNDIWK